MDMIPKVIHFCWFGRNPLPESAIQCVESWKKHMPDYEIKRWDESNFDVNMIPYISEAYAEKKYAFVSDFARFWILYNYGGVYFDTDVEMIQPIHDIIEKGAFLGCETDSVRLNGTVPGVAPGLGMGAPKGHHLLKELLDMYYSIKFKTEEGNNLKTVDQYTTELLCKYNLQMTSSVQYIADIYIYPGEYFGPISVISKRLHKTPNTRTIHLYAATWQTKTLLSRIKAKIRNLLPEFVLIIINKIK